MGYKMINGKIEVDSEKKMIIIHIYKDYLEGTPLHKIAKKLTDAETLNANRKPNWNHSSIGRILKDERYIGINNFPQIIEASVFQKVKERRQSRKQTLGKTVHPNTMKNKSVFTGKLKCGECGELYHKYIWNVGKPTEQRGWKCRNYKTKGHHKKNYISDDELKIKFISTTNQLITKKWMLENKKAKKKEPLKPNSQIRRIEERIKVLEDGKAFSSNELAELIFKRAEAYYNISKIDDEKHNTVKIRQVLKEEIRKNKINTTLTAFDEKLFQTITKQIVIFKEGTLKIEYINGISITESLQN